MELKTMLIRALKCVLRVLLNSLIFIECISYSVLSWITSPIPNTDQDFGVPRPRKFANGDGSTPKLRPLGTLPEEMDSVEDSEGYSNLTTGKQLTRTELKQLKLMLDLKNNNGNVEVVEATKIQSKLEQYFGYRLLRTCFNQIVLICKLIRMAFLFPFFLISLPFIIATIFTHFFFYTFIKYMLRSLNTPSCSSTTINGSATGVGVASSGEETESESSQFLAVGVRDRLRKSPRKRIVQPKKYTNLAFDLMHQTFHFFRIPGFGKQSRIHLTPQINIELPDEESLKILNLSHNDRSKSVEKRKHSDSSVSSKDGDSSISDEVSLTEDDSSSGKGDNCLTPKNLIIENVLVNLSPNSDLADKKNKPSQCLDLDEKITFKSSDLMKAFQEIDEEDKSGDDPDYVHVPSEEELVTSSSENSSNVNVNGSEQGNLNDMSPIL